MILFRRKNCLGQQVFHDIKVAAPIRKKSDKRHTQT